MAPRKKRPARREPVRDEAEEPFNNPFHAAGRKLKRALAAERTIVNERKAPQTPSTPAPIVHSDDDLFRQAVDRAVPLAKGDGRVREVRRARAGASPERTVAQELVADENFDIRFSDQFIRGRAAGVSRETLARLERGEFAVRSHVDLHGMALDDAKEAVDEFLADRQRWGERCVLVVTGKGRNSPKQVGVLRENIPEWLARGPSARRVLAFATARPCDGGEGALYVLLRNRAARKSRIDVEAGGGT